MSGWMDKYDYFLMFVDLNSLFLKILNDLMTSQL